MTRPCFDWQSPHWESWYITVQDRDKIFSKDQLLASACHSPDCGFCSSEIFRKRINRGRNESSATHCSSSWTLFSSWTKLATRLYNHPQAFSFHAFVPTVCLRRKPFCCLVSKTVPPPKDQLQCQLFRMSSHQLGGLPPSCEHSEDFVHISLLTFFIVSHQSSRNDYGKCRRREEKRKKEKGEDKSREICTVMWKWHFSIRTIGLPLFSLFSFPS